MRLCWLGLCLWSAAGLAVPVPAQEEAPLIVKVRAHVLDAAGQPLRDAGACFGPVDEVTTADALQHPQARCISDGLLEFTLPPMRRFDGYRRALLIAAPRKVAIRCPSLTLFTRGIAGDRTWDLGDVRLADGVKISGRLRGREGKPVAGARVLALDCLSIYPWMCPSFGSQAITAADGTFLLEGVFSNAMSIDVQADGYYRKAFACVGVGDPLDLQLAESGFVEGMVIDEQGKPLEGTVEAMYEMPDNGNNGRKVVKGAFRLPVIEPCRFRLIARDPSGSSMVESALLHGPTTGLSLRVVADPEQDFVVHAVDAATGAPVKPIRAAVFWFAGTLDDSLEQHLASSAMPSGGGGTVVLPPPPKEGTKGVVYVAADGHAPLTVESVEGKGGGFEVKLLPESRCEGKVVDAATQKPVAGAEVTCVRMHKAAARRGTGMRPRPVLTAADGSFAFGGLAAASYRLQARWSGGTAEVSSELGLKVGERRQDVLMALPAGATVTGKMTGATPGSGWKLLLAREGEQPADDPWSDHAGILEGWNFEGAVPVASDGSFRFEHRAPGSEVLALVIPTPPRSGPALRIRVSTVRIGGDEASIPCDVAGCLPGTIDGKVTFAGASFPACRLAVIAAEVDGGTGFIDHRQRILLRHFALVAPDGSFQIPAAPKKFQLEAVDVATGVVLFRDDAEVEVKSGKATRCDLTVTAVEATVGFEGDEQGRRSSSRLCIEAGEQRPDRWQTEITLFGGGSLGSPNVDISGLQQETRLFVPPGAVKLHVDVGATQLGHGTIGWGSGQPGANETFEAETGKHSRVTLKLPAPAPLDDK